MAAKSKQAVRNGKSPRENCALRRVLDWPVVNSACHTLQKTYIVTKELHPWLASFCVAWERSIQSVTSLATWSVGPVVEKLEPHLSEANVLACQGLDHLERKIPALHQLVEKVTADMKKSIFAHIQNATCSIVGILNNILGTAAESSEYSESKVKDTVEHMRKTRPSVATEVRKDVTMRQLENGMDFFLQKAEDQPALEPSEESPSTTLEKIRAFMGAVLQQVYKQTTQAIKSVTEKGWRMTAWIPGLVSKPEEKEEAVPRLMVDHLESAEEEGGGGQMETALAQELLLVGQACEARRLSRGHYPLAFINLDDPVPPCQYVQSPHFEAENAGRLAQKSAFSPYKEGAGHRRWSEGLFRISPEVKYTLTHYANLYGSNLKKE